MSLDNLQLQVVALAFPSTVPASSLSNLTDVEERLAFTVESANVGKTVAEPFCVMFCPVALKSVIVDTVFALCP